MSRNYVSKTTLFKRISISNFTWTLSQRTVLELEGDSLTLLTAIDGLVTAKTSSHLGTLATGGGAL